MLDSTDNRLPYAAEGAFTEGPFTDPVVEYFRLIAAGNEQQGAEVTERMRAEELASGIRRAPYYVYYANSGAGPNAAGDSAALSHSSNPAALAASVSGSGSPSGGTEEKNNAALALLKKAKQKVIDKIENNNNSNADTCATAAAGGGEDGSGAPSSMPAPSMVIEGEGEDAPPEVPDEAAVAALIAQWGDEEAVLKAMTALFQTLPTSYGNSSDDIKCERLIAAAIEDQRAQKNLLDAAFRAELQTYQQKGQPALPALEATCEAIDSSQGESRYTLRMLKRTRLQAAARVRVIGLWQQRAQRRRLAAAVEGARTWIAKAESVCECIIAKQYASAALPLGARLKPRDGRYFGHRGAQNALLMSSSTSARAPAPAPLAPLAPLSGDSEDDEEDAEEEEANAFSDSEASPLSSADASSPTDTPLKKKKRRRKAKRGAQPPADERSARERVLASYYASPWDASDSANNDLSFEDFLLGASAEVQAMHCGMAALGQYYALRQIAGKVIGVCVRADVERLLTATAFDRPLLLNTLRGLHALHVRKDDVATFFLELIDPILSARFRAALCDVVGEDAGGTWEAVAKSLIPSELHPCTVSLLAQLADTLRGVMKLAMACGAMVEEHAADPLAFGAEAEGATVLEGCKFLAGIGPRVVHRCLGAAVSYGSNANFRRGNVADCLLVYRLLHYFVLMCSTAVNDKSAAATTGSLRFQWQAVYADHFRAKMLEEAVRVMHRESFSPFPVNAADFQELSVLFERQDEEEAKAVFTQYLVLQPSLSLAPTLEEHLRLDVASNPFRNNCFTTEDYRPVEALTDRKPFSLFEDGHAMFTFSSYFVCRSMIEAANSAKGLAAAAGEMLQTVHGLAAIYIDFILTHFVAESPHDPIESDPKTPAHVQSLIAIIRSTSAQVASTCPAMAASGFPLLSADAPAMAWKARAEDGGAAPTDNAFAMLERATAIASLGTVALCHRLCVQSLTGLLDAADLSNVADMNEAVAGTAKYAAEIGLRRLAKRLASGDALLAAMERGVKWDGGSGSAASMQQSPYTAVLLGDLDAVSARVRAVFKGMPPMAATMVVQHCVFNLMVAFVEGLSRVKKFSDAGRAQALTDALFVTKTVKERYPHTSQRLLEGYVMRYARAAAGQWPDVLALLNDHHALYTTRQLVAFGDREGFMRRREVANIVETLCHEDKLPLFLIEAL